MITTNLADRIYCNLIELKERNIGRMSENQDRHIVISKGDAELCVQYLENYPEVIRLLRSCVNELDRGNNQWSLLQEARSILDKVQP